MNIELLLAYKHARGFIGLNSYAMRDSKGFHAKKSLELAREKLATGKRYYSNRWHWQPQGHINPEFSAFGEQRLRWIENPTWREVGKAHDIAKRNDRWRAIDHTGWYTTHDGWTGETTCGIVYALPARDGERQLIAGYTDQNNEGACCLSFDKIYSDEMEAARAADGIAEIYAEECREGDEAYQAGSRYNDLGDDARECRANIRTVITELKQWTKARAAQYPAIHGTLCDAIRSKLAELEKTREERAELRSNFGKHECFREAAC